MAIAPQAAFLFHVAQVFFLLSYIQWKALFLRVMLFFAFFTLGLWAILATDYYVDTVAWNATFCVINAAFITYMIYQMRRIRLSAEEEELYKACFLPYGNFERLEFKKFYRLGEDRYGDSGT